MKVLMYGDFNLAGGPYDGATTKTRNIYAALKEKYDDVSMFNIEGWRKNPFKKLFQLKKALKNIDVVVFVPGAKHGTYFAINYFAKYKKRNDIRLYYFVAGSLLVDYLKEKPKYIKKASTIDGIFCETHGLIHELNEYGLENVYYSPTFDRRGSFHFKDKAQKDDAIIRFCSFCRVTKEKGIAIACETFNFINHNSELEGITLFYDIYGKLDQNFKLELDKLIEKSDGLIRYMGVIPEGEVIQTLTKYDANIFPTYFKGECLPATIIESYKASIPVIASNWKYNSEFVEEGKTGFLFGNTVSDLHDFLKKHCFNRNPFTSLRKNCFEKSKEFSEEKCLKQLFEMIGENQ